MKSAPKTKPAMAAKSLPAAKVAAAARGPKSAGGRSTAVANSPKKPSAPIPSARGDTKLDSVIAMLRTKDGASLDQLVKATAWQRHSVRGAISGAIKKKLGLNVVSETRDGIRVYRIAR